MLITVGIDCLIAGWGFINITYEINPEKLQALQVKTVNWNICKRQRPRTFLNFHICAGVPGALNKGTCYVIKLLNLKLIFTSEKDRYVI